MSKHELLKTVKRELRELNWRIDLKIVRGLSYREEARRHRILLRQLERLNESRSEGIFGKMASMAAMFMF
ncbi:MAG: hypothetical protein HZA81_02400 [Candidatus Taylorbacteria bacterium]|nr:hypothetical protein [Candidatus Taylorbacteria bacterium]